MGIDYRTDAPPILRDFLTYHEAIQGHSKKTVDEYFLDLRNFFRYIKIEKNKVPRTAEFDSIDINDVDLELVRSVTLTDVYSYMNYLSRDRAQRPNSDQTGYGLKATSRARKVAAIRSFYKYLTNKAKLISENPIQDLDAPRTKKSLPRYLDLDSSIQLLESVDGPFQERDRCILTLFLNCGVRISELIGLNVTDARGDQLRVLGKGNKERILYLNEACIQSIQEYMAVRPGQQAIDKNALFLSRRRTRISKAAVEKLVKKYLTKAGLDSSQYSPHKLRHTAATLMLQNGVDVRTLQELLGHENLNTTQIYTHVDNENLRLAAMANPLGKRPAGSKTPASPPEEME
ncbi:MAG: tyrosine recombinase XerC [Oscillospiraceae bacterium]|jgi:site-specific recombinase XerD|nr:tyrosine recombinase XerC [Oscillospiraceae bacterium]